MFLLLLLMTLFVCFQNGIKKADLGFFVCDENGKKLQKVRITHQVETPHVSWLIFLLVKLAPFPAPEHCIGRKMAGQEGLLRAKGSSSSTQLYNRSPSDQMQPISLCHLCFYL